ncbi:MAG TPA: glutamine--fructose-6-phosphate transaminase (isomerizing) [Thermoanaerobaculaceae bacterium]|nr:glutamine--fructose-6-phosphate transaminase (isomerizing) [Thermoanaerobaculaceae bacterium]HRS14848.1 glutamine--fructose-6-phosphate transaminase (isomerizing) [Thermoanaerobaculaceae bacterium]
MCGIFGIVTDREQALGPVLVDAARRLSYRGYDSVGAATFRADRSVDLRKDKGKVDEVASRLGFAEMTGVRGITQLRWATFGTPSMVNAQPHFDSDGDLVGAHNGNVVNNVELREQFAAEGMTVRSENDGESCVHAVERWFDRGCDMVEAIRRAFGDLQGDYAFVIGHVEEDTLYAIKKGSGLVVGLADGFTCVSSDLPSILPLTRKIVRVFDGEIVVLHADRVELLKVADGTRIEREPEEIVDSMEAAQKGGFPHFMLKEIHEQPQVARELLHLLDASPDVAGYVEKMRRARHLYLVACGTSHHACVLGAVYLARLAGRAAVPVLAPQFIAQYGPALGPEDVGVFVSQSGETKDVLNALNVARERGVEVLALVNVIGSTLMVTSDRCLPLACGYEISVPATKTFLNQVLAFLYLAMRLGGHPTAILHDLPGLIERTLAQVEPQVPPLGQALLPWHDTYCLGYGATYPIALEGALKLKEVTYIHCEGMLSTEFKHGPLSAVSEGYPVIFVAGPENVPLIVSGINEVACRGGRTIIVGEEDPRLRANGHDMLVLPRSGPLFSPILGILPLQLLAYHVSVAKGYDPDFPRNLSKTLTVD